MPVHVENLLVFLASPGDVSTERDHVDDVVDEVNRLVAARKGVILQVKSWERDTFPGYGTDAQSVINEQIAEMKKYSLFIGIMWNRIGTQTPRATSGTVEEFERAVDALEENGQPEIWFYFSQSPAVLTRDEQWEQRRKVLEFENQVKSKGMPWRYENPDEFKEIFRRHLTMWLNQREPPDKDEELSHEEMEIVNILRHYQEYCLHVFPYVPSDLESIARKVCELPDTEIVLGLIIPGPHKDYLIFGRKGIYFRSTFRSPFRAGAIPYTEFPRRTFEWGRNAFERTFRRVTFGNGQFIIALAMTPDTLTRMLNEIKDAISKRGHLEQH